MKIKKKILLISVTCLFFAFFANSAALALEITYPQILGLPAIGPNSGLVSYVIYWFGFLVYAAAGLAIISFAIGAVQLMMAINPEIVSNAKSRMIGSIVGLVLCVSAYVLLETINPSFVSPVLTNLPAESGVFLTTGSEYQAASQEVADVSLMPPGYDRLLNRCNNNTYVLVWLFAKKNLEYSPGDRSYRVPCGQEVNVSGAGSFRWIFETPGVYFCMGGCSGDMCSGYMSMPQVSSKDEIENPFKGNIKGVRIVNDPYLSEYYGAIFHEEIGLENGGACTQPIYFENSGGCKNINVAAYATDIFHWNKDYPITSGDGLTLYSETYGWNADVQSGTYEIYGDEVQNFYQENADGFIFDWTNIESTTAALCNEYPDLSCWEENPSDEDAAYIMMGECCPCTNFQDCPGSIRVRGNYVVALYSDAEDDDGNRFLYCQTFTKDVENLNAYNYTQPKEYIKYINIIPTE
ncbi:MAG TPA: pilin [Candidatus Staskawiczbacteria bacterium]|nr:pilin [Candidatus Staskawiczbacteria bacterium]